MTDQERKAMEMALEALERSTEAGLTGIKVDEAITALRQALAQPDHGFDRTASHMAGEYVDATDTSSTYVDETKKREHEPVAWNGWVLREVFFDNGEPCGHREPPSKPWVSLTDDELRNAYCEVSGNEWCLGGISNAETFYDAIESALRSKNT